MSTNNPEKTQLLQRFIDDYSLDVILVWLNRAERSYLKRKRSTAKQKSNEITDLNKLLKTLSQTELEEIHRLAAGIKNQYSDPQNPLPL